MSWSTSLLLKHSRSILNWRFLTSLNEASGVGLCVPSRYVCCRTGSGVGQSASQCGHPAALSGGQRRTAGAERLSVQPGAQQHQGANQSTTYPMILCQWLAVKACWELWLWSANPMMFLLCFSLLSTV